MIAVRRARYQLDAALMRVEKFLIPDIPSFQGTDAEFEVVMLLDAGVDGVVGSISSRKAVNVETIECFVTAKERIGGSSLVEQVLGAIQTYNRLM